MENQHQQPSSSAKSSPVEASVINGEVFVWSAASIATLRREYGIVGLLTGSLPLIPQQNAFLGVPLQLFEEEVVYLLRRKALILVDDPKAHNLESLSGEELEDWHRQRIDSVSERRRMAVEEARKNKEKSKTQFSMSESAKEKKKAREERKRSMVKAATDDEVDESLFQPTSISKPVMEEDLKNISHLITIPSSSSGLQWHNVELGKTAFDSLSSAASAGLWRYPETADQRAKCAAFEALKEEGYYLGKGLRFGGDFVVYPGDPLRYHSHFTATVQTTPASPISAQELISAGRLGTAVKKAHLLCSVKARDGAVDGEGDGMAWQRRIEGQDDLLEQRWGKLDYISLTWASFGV